MSKIPSQFTDAHQSELAEIVGFNADDLAANRRGQLSARQIAQLRRDQRRRTWPSMITAGGLAAAILVLAALSSASIVERGLSVGASMLLAVYTALEARAAVRPIGRKPDQVEACRWQMNDRWDPARFLNKIEFRINAQWFSADRALADCLRKGQSYQLYYYAPEWSVPGVAIGASRSLASHSGRFPLFARYGSHRVLSIEPLSRAGYASTIERSE